MQFVGRVDLELLEYARDVFRVAVGANFAKPFAEFVLAFDRLLSLLLLQGVPNFGTRAGRYNILQPVLLGGLLPRGDDFDLVAARQGLAQRHQLVVDLRADALRTDLGVDAERKIERCCSSRKGDEFAVGRKNVDLVGKEVELEFVNEADGIGFAAFEDLANLP